MAGSRGVGCAPPTPPRIPRRPRWCSLMVGRVGRSHALRQSTHPSVAQNGMGDAVFGRPGLARRGSILTAHIMLSTTTAPLVAAGRLWAQHHLKARGMRPLAPPRQVPGSSPLWRKYEVVASPRELQLPPFRLRSARLKFRVPPTENLGPFPVQRFQVASGATPRPPPHPGSRTRPKQSSPKS